MRKHKMRNFFIYILKICKLKFEKCVEIFFPKSDTEATWKVLDINKDNGK